MKYRTAIVTFLVLIIMSASAVQAGISSPLKTTTIRNGLATIISPYDQIQSLWVENPEFKDIYTGKIPIGDGYLPLTVSLHDFGRIGAPAPSAYYAKRGYTITEPKARYEAKLTKYDPIPEELKITDSVTPGVNVLNASEALKLLNEGYEAKKLMFLKIQVPPDTLTRNFTDLVVTEYKQYTISDGVNTTTIQSASERIIMPINIVTLEQLKQQIPKQPTVVIPGTGLEPQPETDRSIPGFELFSALVGIVIVASRITRNNRRN